MTYITEVLGIYDKADCHSDLFWRVQGDEVKFFANCSDLFMWASADLEEITPEDVPLLRQCLADLQSSDEAIWISELFCSRKRNMQPMTQFGRDHMDGYKRDTLKPEVRALFSACGLPRTPGDEDWWKADNYETRNRQQSAHGEGTTARLLEGE